MRNHILRVAVVAAICIMAGEPSSSGSAEKVEYYAEDQFSDFKNTGRVYTGPITFAGALRQLPEHRVLS